ncbi:hypothetical protein [Marinicrinis lubricantis]|uniref:LexA repressor DNA-binding domain-containing protein n=1 Tax=Marinicrinis lubricantis TaxID=2086470 RepID=A0ABW1IL68_9BACL
MDGGPRPSTKGEQKRIQIARAILQYRKQHLDDPTIEDIKQITGIRSYNTLSRHVTLLKQEGYVEWDNHVSPKIKWLDSVSATRD